MPSEKGVIFAFIGPMVAIIVVSSIITAYLIGVTSTT